MTGGTPDTAAEGPILDRRHPASQKSVLEALLAALQEELTDPEAMHVTTGAEWSNQLTEVHVRHSSRLVVKQARYDWEAPRFRAAHLAAQLLLRRTGVRAPRHIDVGHEIDGRAVEAYWHIDLPTLAELWPGIAEPDRPRLLRSWGELLRRVHKVRLAGHGPLEEAIVEPCSLGTFLAGEIERLAPSVGAHWKAAMPTLDAMRELVPEIAERVGAEPVLLHNDPHMANVLCERRERGGPRCVGVIDLEAAMSGPAAADLAHVQVLHGPLFRQPLPGSEWFAHLLEGYGEAPDPVAMAFFRAYHLLNLGCHAALVGMTAHADDVARAAEAEIEALAERQGSCGLASAPRDA